MMDKDSEPMTPPTSLNDKPLKSYRNYQISTNQKREQGKVASMKDKDSDLSPMTPPTSLYDKPLKRNSKKQELSNIDQSEEGAGLIYTNEGQGL